MIKLTPPTRSLPSFAAVVVVASAIVSALYFVNRDPGAVGEAAPISEAPSQHPLARADAAADVGGSTRMREPMANDEGAPSVEGAAPATENPTTGTYVAWASYDERAERNNRARVDQLGKAMERYTAASDTVTQANAAFTVAKVAAFVLEDHARTSRYTSSGERHTPKDGHHTFSNGGAVYQIPYGRYDALDRAYSAVRALRPGPFGASTDTAALPAALEVAALHDRAMDLLGAYQ